MEEGIQTLELTEMRRDEQYHRKKWLASLKQYMCRPSQTCIPDTSLLPRELATLITKLYTSQHRPQELGRSHQAGSQKLWDLTQGA